MSSQAETAADVLPLLPKYVGAAVNDATLEGICDTAADLVFGWLGEAYAKVPDNVLQRGVLETASELFHRQNAPMGVMQVSTFDGSAGVKTSIDPMLRVYPMLRSFIGGGFA